MVFRPWMSRRDVLLIFIGAAVMQLWAALHSRSSVHLNHEGEASCNVELSRLAVSTITTQEPVTTGTTSLNVAAYTDSVTTTVTPESTALPAVTSAGSTFESAVDTAVDTEPGSDFQYTSLVAHAPGWTLLRNLYMSNGTLYIVSSNRSFPEIRMMTSTGIAAQNSPENVALREPTSLNMDYMMPEEARQKWGGDVVKGEKNRIWTIEGNTFLFNDPPQFLRHYYHFVAELIFGAWAFWHGVWLQPSTSPDMLFQSSNATLPVIRRAIFSHSNGWRDRSGFNAYVFRAVFPSVSVENEKDWEDRIIMTSGHLAPARAWHFPMVLLVDRSASFRGKICGTQTQRTASEAWEFVKKNNQLLGEQVGGWWDPIRRAVWKFAAVPHLFPHMKMSEIQVILSQGKVGKMVLPNPDKVVITYISRQGGPRRKLTENAHHGLVKALQELVQAKGPKWEFNVIQAEKMSNDDQIRAIARTSILLGVHGNGLSHLVFMPPTRLSAVIEIFYPGGFAQDYEWTSVALGMDYYGVWNDKNFTHSTKPRVNYPDGFQGSSIPVDGPVVSKLIEEHVDRWKEV